MVLAVALAPPAGAQEPVAPAAHALYADGPDGRYLLDAGWTTRADPLDAGLVEGWQQPGAEEGFAPVVVPDAFNAASLTRAGFRAGIQWYRVRFALPDDPLAVGWRLRFESVSNGATVWVNGVRAGAHRGAYLPFEVPGGALRPGTNEMVVRVDGRIGRSDLPSAAASRGWWNYAGILREVYLRRVAALDLERLHVTARLGDPARLEVSAPVRNASGVPVQAGFQTLELEAPTDALSGSPAQPGPAPGATAEPAAGRTLAPGELGSLSARLTIPGPRLWTPGHPNLYRLRLVLAGGQEWTVHVGLRRFTHDRRGRLYLNGRRLLLRGTSFHEQVPGRGAALTPADRDAIVARLRALGANLARQHYPPHPALLEAFDRYGILFWEQVPAFKLRGSLLRSGPIQRRALGMLRDAVLRDRNHASVLTWSIANETDPPRAGEATYVRRAVALIRRYDRTRLIGADATAKVGEMPSAYRRLTAIGLNEYRGWYDDAAVERIFRTLRALHVRFSRQVLVATEFGAEADRRGSARAKGTYAFQRRYLQRQLRVMDRTPFLTGALVWVLRDFVVRPGWAGGNPRPDPPFTHKGLLTLGGRAKPAWATVREAFARFLRGRRF